MRKMQPLVTPLPQAKHKVLSPRSASKCNAEGTVRTLISVASDDTALRANVTYITAVKGDYQKITFETGPLSDAFSTTTVKYMFLHLWLATTNDD